MGDTVQLRKAPEDVRRFNVTDITGEKATIEHDGGSEQVAVADLLVVKEFGDPIYPTVTPVGSIERGGERDPHLVINSENFHALQVLAYTHAGKADLIYLDPPYNTGDSDWKYNNAYVDDADRYRHSSGPRSWTNACCWPASCSRATACSSSRSTRRNICGLGWCSSRFSRGAASRWSRP